MRKVPEMKTIFTGILIAVLAVFLSTALGLAVIHISGFPFSADVDKLNLCGSAGLSKNGVIQNYDAALRFLSPFSNAGFSLPSMKYSQSGSLHFAQCKKVFGAIYLLGGAAALALAALALKNYASKLTLRLSAVLTLLIPTFLSAFLAINFDRAFILFHKLIFPGTSWLFDPNTDEIIKILPMRFFLHCACFIALFWILGAALLTALSSVHKTT